MRLLGRTPPVIEYQEEEEHAEKGDDNNEKGELAEKEEPGSVAETTDRSSKGVYYNLLNDIYKLNRMNDI